VGSPDFTEQRVLRLLLASLDVAPKVAERLVAESAGQVRQMLGYVFYQRERGQAVRAPGRYVMDGVAAGWSYEGHDDFQRWLRERQADLRAPVRLVRGEVPEGEARDGGDGSAARGEPSPVSRPAVSRPTDGVSPSVPVTPGIDRLVLPPVGTDVLAWWEAAASEVSAQLHPLARAYLERARPAAHSAVTLLVVADTDGESVRLGREAHVLSGALAHASGGAVCEVLVLSPQQWLGPQRRRGAGTGRELRQVAPPRAAPRRASAPQPFVADGASEPSARDLAVFIDEHPSKGPGLVTGMGGTGRRGLHAMRVSAESSHLPHPFIDEQGRHRRAVSGADPSTPLARRSAEFYRAGPDARW
jgi:hypothetical protein